MIKKRKWGKKQTKSWRRKIICNASSEWWPGCVTDSHKTTFSYPWFVLQHTSAHSQMFLPGAQRRTSQEQLEPDLYSRLQLMLSSTCWVTTLTGEQFLFCWTDCSERTQPAENRETNTRQQNYMTLTSTTNRDRVRWLGYGLGRYWVRIPEGPEKHFLQYIQTPSCSTGTRVFFLGLGVGVKQLGSQVNNTSPSSAKVKNERSCTLATIHTPSWSKRYLFPCCVYFASWEHAAYMPLQI